MINERLRSSFVSMSECSEEISFSRKLHQSTECGKHTVFRRSADEGKQRDKPSGKWNPSGKTENTKFPKRKCRPMINWFAEKLIWRNWKWFLFDFLWFSANVILLQCWQAVCTFSKGLFARGMNERSSINTNNRGLNSGIFSLQSDAFSAALVPSWET